MFREAGGALSRQPSQDNGLDGPFGSGGSKLEQVCGFLTVTAKRKPRLSVRTQLLPNDEEKRDFALHFFVS